MQQLCNSYNDLMRGQKEDGIEFVLVNGIKGGRQQDM